MDSLTIETILDYLRNELGGDWLLTGGSLVRLSFDASRGTEDVDLMRIAHPSLSDEASRNALFRWLIARGLGPEWVNSTVEPFVREVSEWRDEIVPLLDGPKGRIFRPTLTLFAHLKLRRGTDVDLADIRAAARSCPEGFDQAKFRRWSDPDTWARYLSSKAALGLSSVRPE